MTAVSAGWARTYAWLLRALDAGLVLVAGAFALRIAGLDFFSPVSGGEFVTALGLSHGLVIVVVLALWLVSLELVGSRKPGVFAKGSEEFVATLNSAFPVFLLLASLSYLLRAEPSRLFVGVFLSTGIALLIVGRALGRQFIWFMRSHERMLTTVFLVGSAASNLRMKSHLEQLASGYRVVGNVPVARKINQGSDLISLTAAIEESGTSPDLVVLTTPSHMSAQTMEEFAARLELIPLAFGVASSPDGLANARLKFGVAPGVPILRVQDVQLGFLSRLSKRALDMLASSVALLLLSPMIAAVSLWIRLDSDGPAFFQQERVGQFGRRFTILKFRTMYIDAEKRRHLLEYAARDAGNEVLFKLREDPRVTRAGKFLRRWSLDEIPQLFNVVKGEMSLVGPRPPLPSEVEDYEGPVYRRLVAKPGLTGLWQVSGRSELSWEESVRLDLQYVEEWSPLSDFIIVVKTIPAVIGRRGAF